MLKPFASVVVLNWNGRDCIRLCLRSLLSQTYSNYEVIVVDNASTDGSAEIVEEEFPEVRLIRNKRNLGFAAGNNVGIKAARGEFIVLFNNDAFADENWLARLVDEVSRDPKVGIASGPIYYCEPKDVVWCAGARLDLATGMAWHLAQYEREFTPCGDVDYFPACALLVKREVFDRIGLLDERFFVYAEDPDFCLRARWAGFRLKFVPDAVVYHRVSMGMLHEPVRVQYVKLESEFKFILKVWPYWCLPLTLFLRLMVIPLWEIVFLRQSLSRLGLTWRGFFNALIGGHKAERNSRVGTLLRFRLRECLRVAKKRAQRMRKIEFSRGSSSIERGVPTGETLWDYGVVKRIEKIRQRWEGGRGVILDVGCGYEAYIKAFAKNAVLAVGLDVEREFIKRAKKRNSGSNIEFVLGSGEFLPFRDEVFDSAFLIETLEHVLDEAKVLNEVHRVLSCSGEVIITVPNKFFPFETHSIKLGLKIIEPPIPFFSWLPNRIRNKHERARIYTPSALVKSLTGQFSLRQINYIPPLLEGRPFQKNRCWLMAVRNLIEKLFSKVPFKYLSMSILVVAQKKK